MLLNLIRTIAQGKLKQLLIWLGMAIATSQIAIFVHLQPLKAQVGLPYWRNIIVKESLLTNTDLSESSLPVPKTHPLPETLAQWQDLSVSGDYFSEVETTPLGYLIWSEFPVKIYWERPNEAILSPSSLRRFQEWVDAVTKAVEEWSAYLPLELVRERSGADISILRSHPPFQASINPETGEINLPRARSAETRYEFYLRRGVGTPRGSIISHRFTIELTPDQTAEYTLATARHEIGHALGIWGHSPIETDALYFSQVGNPPQISVRDINTLKRVYEQPTRLGWSLVAGKN
ncbi:MAG: peptidase [Merismopedia sp. SIO2A8]|nr:peptidase [Symploca sp. SIO2B6]NET50417.1 peptidase [Merismopedia sp. SIO2A8]